MRSSDRRPTRLGLSTEACRSLIGAAAETLSDGQVNAIRDQLYAVARVVLGARARSRPFELALATLSPEERADSEERAAILECDGKLPRDQAERLAVSNYRKVPPRA